MGIEVVPENRNKVNEKFMLKMTLHLLNYLLAAIVTFV
jgi:hypothetical protein